MKRMTRVVLGSVVALALLLGLFGAGRLASVAQAQSPTPSAPTAPTGQPPTNTLEQSFWQALAGKLGISIDQLTSAVKAAGKDVVSSELSAGRITQDQATQANSRIDGWQPGQGLPLGKGGRGHGGPGDFGGPNGGQAVFDAAAKALGMTTADLQTALQSGQTLSAIAQSKGVSADTVKAAIVAAKKAQVDADVQAGRLTADQATQIKQQIDQEAATETLDNMLHGGRGHGFGGPGGHDGPGAPGATPQPRQTPSAATGA